MQIISVDAAHGLVRNAMGIASDVPTWPRWGLWEPDTQWLRLAALLRCVKDASGAHFRGVPVRDAA